MSDLISRQAAIDALEKVADFFPYRVPGNRDTYDRYNEAWNDAIGRAEIEIEALPSAQPEKRTEKRMETHACDLISRQAVLKAIDDYERLSVMSQTVRNMTSLREIVQWLPAAQPEPSIPLSWVEKHIEWLKSLDNDFANLAGAHISVMVKKWRGEQHEVD